MKDKIEKKMKYWINNYNLLNNQIDYISSNILFADMTNNIEEKAILNKQKQELCSKRDDMIRMFRNCDDLYLTEITHFLLNMDKVKEMDKELKKLVLDITKKIQLKVDYIDNLLTNARQTRNMPMVSLLSTTERLLKENTKLCFGLTIKPTTKQNKRK